MTASRTIDDRGKYWPHASTTGTITKILRRVAVIGAFQTGGIRHSSNQGRQLWGAVFVPDDFEMRLIDLETQANSKNEAVMYFKSIFPRART